MSKLNSKLAIVTESLGIYKSRAMEAEQALRLLYASGELEQLGHKEVAVHCYNKAASVVGVGYSKSELSTTIYRHVNHVIDEISELSRGDVLKQLELSERVFKSLRGRSQVAMEQKRCRVQNSILAGLKMWHHTMIAKHNGRFSNVDRAAEQAVQTAIAAGLNEGDYSEAERLTGFNRQVLAAASDR